MPHSRLRDPCLRARGRPVPESPPPQALRAPRRARGTAWAASFLGLAAAAAAAALPEPEPARGGPIQAVESPDGDAIGAFDRAFTGRTLRLDYLHAGTAAEERIAVEGLRLEGDWAGSRVQLLDTTNLGKYHFAVVDPSRNVALYSRGFSSIYGEWETTGEARAGTWRAFEESLRFPEPRARFQLVLRKRGADGAFREIHSGVFDPSSRHVDRSALRAPLGVQELVRSGPPASKLDLLVLGDGYRAEDEEKFHRDAGRLVAALFEVEPFRSRRGDFNVRAHAPPARESGISDPRRGVWRGAPLGLSFNAFDSDRYVLTFRDRELRETAAAIPHDALAILANVRKYGGGGIFNLWATCTADTSTADYVFIHELGHSIAGLADEYYTSQVAYEDFTPPGVEPWEPNITGLLDPARLKWADLASAGTPVPTPWGKDAHDKVSIAFQKRREDLTARGASDEEMEALFEEVKRATRPLLDAEAHVGKVGAFEGAGYESKGLYRPAADCIMFSRNRLEFCPVCRGAIERAIDLHAR